MGFWKKWGRNACGQFLDVDFCNVRILIVNLEEKQSSLCFGIFDRNWHVTYILDHVVPKLRCLGLKQSLSSRKVLFKKKYFSLFYCLFAWCFAIVELLSDHQILMCLVTLRSYSSEHTFAMGFMEKSCHCHLFLCVCACFIFCDFQAVSHALQMEDILLWYF